MKTTLPKLAFIGIGLSAFICAIVADTAPPEPKQIIVPFSESEQVRMAAIQKDIENFRRDVCWVHEIKVQECGQLAGNGVYKILPPEPPKENEKK